MLITFYYKCLSNCLIETFRFQMLKINKDKHLSYLNWEPNRNDRNDQSNQLKGIIFGSYPLIYDNRA